MKVKDLLKMSIDIDVYDADSDGIGIAFCGPMELTEEGKKKFKDVLEYEVEFNKGTCYGDIAVVTVPDSEDYDEGLRKAEDLFYALAGDVSPKKYNNWFKEV